MQTDSGEPWPPPDPDRIPRRQFKIEEHDPFTYGADSSGLDVQAFRERQQKDALRFADPNYKYRPRSLGRAGRNDSDDEADNSQESNHCQDDVGSGLEWRDSEGDRMQDFGVDEEAEWYEEENLSLAEVLRRRKI